ncbi:MAG: hypothetical protein K2X01_07750 [Cyanobacteria bacterium]|nr:hypothetical protein [Cyanobacteriota bacterium]
MRSKLQVPQVQVKVLAVRRPEFLSLQALWQVLSLYWPLAVLCFWWSTGFLLPALNSH